jgi:hypothetical protein
MRGPLLSGPLGSSATLTWVVERLRPHGAVVVLSALWLAEALAAALPVLALIEPDKRRAGRKAQARAARQGHRLLVAEAGEALPLGREGAGAFVVEGLSDVEEDATVVEFLVSLAASLRPDGVLLALEVTKTADVQERLAGLFLGAALTGISQDLPRDGVVATVGRPPPASVLAARLGAAAE